MPPWFMAQHNEPYERRFVLNTFANSIRYIQSTVRSTDNTVQQT